MTGRTGNERVLGRYALFDEIAAGGMATVHLGRMLGPVGFSKTVAIKCLHPHLARDPEFVSMFLDEARVAARIQHPNVVATLDVVASDGEVFLVLDYVQGESFSHLLKATRVKGVPIGSRVLASILVNTLHGLHAAHEATDEHGRPLGIVHRDVSPQNVLVGVDGVARVLDFGVAKAAGRMQNTRDGQLKGKLAYMAPEQIRGDELDRRTDIYAAAALMWEGFAGRRLIHGMSEGQVLGAVLAGGFPPPSSLNPSVPPEVDALVMRGLAMSPAERWSTAREFAIAVERTIGVASPYEVAEWVQSVGAETLAIRAARVREMESTSAVRVSLHDASGPQVFHDPPRFDASRSGITQSPVAHLGTPPPPPLPHQPGPMEGSSSFALHPSLVAHGYSQPAQPLPGALAPAWPGSPQPAVAPTSRGKVIFASVAVSAVFGLSIIMLFVWFRGRSRAPESAIEVSPTTASVTAPSTGAAAPEAAPEPSAAPIATGIAVVDLPEDKPSPPAPKPDRPAPAAAKPDKPTTEKPPQTQATATATKQPPKVPKGCETPFTVDSSGIKHIKPECM